MQLYYLGPKGTFSYLACRQYFSENEATFQPKSNLFEVITRQLQMMTHRLVLSLLKIL